jgi:hypothetical protein
LVLAFYTSCVAAFLFGARAARFLAGGPRYLQVPAVQVGSPLLYLGVPMFLATVGCCVYLKLLGGKINVMALLAAQDGNAIKMAGQVGQLETGRWSSSLLMLTAILWWASFRAKQLRLKGSTRYIFYTSLVVAAVVDVLTCIATVDRTNLMPLIGGLGIIFAFWGTRGERVRLYRVVCAAVSSSVAVVGLFLGIAVLRGSAGLRFLVMGILGYTIVSYNRMAALLLGVMHDSYEGRGAYLCPILREEHLDGLFHMSSRFDWPSPFSLWLSAFSSVSSGGLSPIFNFYSVFGALYSDLGWFAVVYMFGMGIVAGYLWLLFRSGKTVGLVLYPWCGFSILFWTGFNIMFDLRLVGIVKIAVALAIYDRVRLRRPREITEIDVKTEAEKKLFAPSAVLTEETI